MFGDLTNTSHHPFVFASTNSRSVPQIKCPDCGSSHKVTIDGWNANGMRLCMDIDGQPYYIWCQRFRCANHHGQNITFLGYDERVLQQLPGYITDQFPAIISRKSAIDKRVWALVSRQIRNGQSLDDIAGKLVGKGW